MIKILRENRSYFLALSFLLLLASSALLFIQTGDFILFFSEHRSPFMDWFFIIGNIFGEEPAYLIIGIICLFFRFRYALMVGAIGGVVTLISLVLKAFFLHDRPSVFFYKSGLLDTINQIEGVHLLTGQSSFPSGHTMSAFALYSLLVFLLPKKQWIAFLLLGMAIATGLARIYLVQHFLKDVVAGAVVGVLIAMVFYWLHLKFDKKQHWWLDGSLKNFNRA